MALKVPRVPSRKTQIKQRIAMEKEVVPHHPAICIFCGSVGSGKTNLCTHLLMTDVYYGPSFENMQTHDEKGRPIKYLEARPYYDVIILLTGTKDDMYDQLKEDKIIDLVIENPTKEDLEKILKTQETLLAEADADILKIPRMLLICDDILGDRSLMQCQAFRTMSTKNRHLNLSIWYLAQYIKFVPRAIREQATHTFIFRPTAECAKTLGEIYREPGMAAKTFDQILQFCTANQPGEKNFMYVNKLTIPENRFRKNLGEYLVIPGMKPPQPPEFDVEEIRTRYKKARQERVVEPEQFPFEQAGIALPSEVAAQSKRNRRKVIVSGQNRVYL